MTTEYFNKLRLDTVLKMFVDVPNGRIDKIVLCDNTTNEFYSAVSLLATEGYLKEDKYGFEITFKGKAFFEQGGFVGEYRRERTLFYCTIVAAVSGVLGLLLSIGALCC